MCYIYSVNTIKAHEHVHVSCVKKKILVMNNITQISKAKHIKNNSYQPLLREGNH